MTATVMIAGVSIKVYNINRPKCLCPVCNPPKRTRVKRTMYDPKRRDKEFIQ